MELNITEISNEDNFDFDLNYQQFNSSFEQIPENVIEPSTKIHQTIPKQNARMVRPNIAKTKPNISYEDILSKMGMFVSEGQLHLLDNKSLHKQEQIKQQIRQQQQQQTPQIKQQIKQVQTNIPSNIPANSYIYNKYFKEELQSQPNIRKPLTREEYRRMLLEDILQKERIKQIKSTKLVMPTSNIHMASNSANLNRLFNFSKR